jgi:hypothetical protein
MNIPDLTVILGNISRSLDPVQHLITGCAYLLGLVFFITGMGKLHEIGGKGSQSSGMNGAMVYFLMGACLLYLPNAMSILSNTAFGMNSALNYVPYNPTNFYTVMEMIINTAGIVWFVRGAALIAQSSAPGTQEGFKGIAFLIAGVFAMNFVSTVGLINTIINSIIAWTLSISSS